MKRILLSLMLWSIPILSQQPKPSQQNKPKPDSTKVVLSNFLQIILSFFNILQNPHNPQNVATNVGAMAMHMATIAQEAKRLGLLPENYTPEEFAQFIENLDEDTKRQMANSIASRLAYSSFDIPRYLEKDEQKK